MGAHPAVRSPLIRRGACLVAAILTTAGLLTSAGAASAAPQPSVSSVQAKVNKLTNQLNVLNQQYDVASQNLAAARQRLALVSKEIGREQVQFQDMRAQIGGIASFAYENGNMTSTAAVLTSSNPQTVLSQSAYLIHLASNRYEQVQQFITDARQLTEASSTASGSRPPSRPTSGSWPSRRQPRASCSPSSSRSWPPSPRSSGAR